MHSINLSNIKINMRFKILLIAVFLIYSCNNTVDKKDELLTEDTESHELILQQKFDTTLARSAILIRHFIENKEPDLPYELEGNRFYSSILLPKFYIEKSFKSVWITIYNDVSKVKEMLEFIDNLEFHGLNPTHYHQALIAEKLEELAQDSQLIFNPHFISKLDLILSDAFFITASHLYHGKVDPVSLKALWGIQRNKPELVLDEKLSEMLESESIEKYFELFYPPHPGYKFMFAEARKLNEIKSQDFKVNTDPKSTSIKRNEESAYLPQIRKKLAFLGFYTPDSVSESTQYDLQTMQAVLKLQAQFGFNTDTVLGKNAIAALNTPVEQLQRRLYVNMERLRWMPDTLEEKYIIVNIADFTLSMMSGKDTILSMRTVVGKNFRQTPVFNSVMSYLVFSPTWTVPPGIMRNDIIPAVSKNPGYLASKNMIVLDKSGNRVDPSTVNWRQNGVRYTVRQMPGLQNALGKVKFMFPNKYSVYLHDTPTRELFARDERTFSSGCIRIEKPFELAKVLLADLPKWDDEAIFKAMNSQSERTVVLKTPVGVYLYYLTAWSGPKGNIYYRNDVYSRDAEVYEALLVRRK
jgi:L,D-transpeptidase YcbB